jgi:thiamine biosynthesis lipoprotein
MGSDAHVVVVGDASLLDTAQLRIEDLEARWSRFRADSELTRMNEAAGRPTVVSPDTALLVSRCIEAWRATDGAFDPTVHDAVVALGYDRDFLVLPAGGPSLARPGTPAPGLADAVVDHGAGFAWVPPGVHLDPGAIGKGLAADLVCQELLLAGADGACVGIGGDVRVAGSPGDRDAWSISIEDPHDPPRELTRIDLADGAVATSSRLRRRWSRGGVELHHVIDPRTGRPVETRIVAVSVVTRDAWWAEVRATEAMLARDPIAEIDDVDLVVVDEDGDIRATDAFWKVLTCSRP